MPVIGHNQHRYKVISDWGKLDFAKFPVKDCHEMVIDSKGRIILLTNETKNNILIYNKDGKLLEYWGKEYPGGHGLSLYNENGEEALFICDHDRHQVIKTDLTGRVLMIIDYPKETGVYNAAEQFKPTETAFGSNGDIYITDGYGLQYVIQYDSKGKYIQHWGGLGDKSDQFNCVHGIAIDTRKKEQPSLIITSRNHNAFKRFTLDGNYIETIYLPGSFVCRPVIKGDFLYAAVFRSGANTNFGSGYITILDKDNRVISTPGGSEPQYVDNKLLPQFQQGKVFIHPHDVCIDNDENIYVCQWNSEKTYPIKLERIK
jgi:hypothetical protein